MKKKQDAKEREADSMEEQGRKTQTVWKWVRSSMITTCMNGKLMLCIVLAPSVNCVP